MSKRNDPLATPVRRDGGPTAGAERSPRGRLRVVGPDGIPIEAATPASRRMWQLAEEGFWYLHVATGDLDVTPTLHAMIGARLDSGPPEWAALVHPDDRALVHDEIARLVTAPGAETTLECRVLDNHGSYRWMRVRATAEFEGARCIAFMGSARDVTDRHRSEGIFEKMVQQHALILNAAGEGICCIDAEGRATFANPAAARLLGVSVQELLGHPVCRHMESCGYDGGRNSVHTADCLILGPNAPSHANRQQDERFRRTDGTRFDAQIITSPISDQSAQGAVVVFNDVTQKKAHERAVKETRERMAEAEKLAALGTLVSGVGHELRTPMSYINNHLYIMQRTAERLVAEDPDMHEVGAELARRCETSMKGIARMSTLLDDLRETYKPDDAEFSTLDIRGTVETAVDLYRGAYRGPVRLETRLDETGVMPAQEGRLQQVIINLLNNAAEAMPDGGTVHLTTYRRGEQVIIEVHDDGPGMAPDVQRSIFAPFFTTKKSGSGLGLYLVKQIIDRHMGRISCDTEVGRGTTFRIELDPNMADAAHPGLDTWRGPRQRRAAAGQESTPLASTPIPSTSSTTSSPGDR